MIYLSWGEVRANIFIIGKYYGGSIFAEEVDKRIF